MANTRILWNNLWRQGTIIAKTTENAQFPAVLTQDDNTTLPWRSTAIAAEQQIDVDLTTAQEYNEVVILNHNFQAGATIKIYGADNTGFSTNLVTDTITFNGNNLRFFLAASRTKRYVRIGVTDTTNPSGYIQMGTIVVGKYLDMGVGVRADGYADGYSDETAIENSQSRNMFITQARPTLISKTLGFAQITDAVKASVLQLLAACGHHYAIDICLDSATPNSYSTWCCLTEAVRPSYSFYSYWNWDVEVLEHV